MSALLTAPGMAMASWSAPIWAIETTADQLGIDHVRQAARTCGVSAWLMQSDLVVIADDGSVSMIRQAPQVEVSVDERGEGFHFTITVEEARAGVDLLGCLDGLHAQRMELLRSAVAELLAVLDLA